MIFEDSRYADARVYRVLTAAGQALPAVYAPMYLPIEFEFTPYIIKEGDRLDLLAYEMYGEPELWWLIAIANPEFEFPQEIPVGESIRIPHEPRA